MKFCLLVLFATLALASAAVPRGGNYNSNYYGTSTPYRSPQAAKYGSSSNNDKDMKTLRNEQKIEDDGSYHYAYETENHIVGEESGVGGVSVQGSSSYISPEGIEIKTTYVADETGYHPVGDHIPKTPDYVFKALEYIRTHPFKKSNDYESGSKAAASNQYRINTNIAPPTRKPTPTRRVTPSPYRPQPTKVTAKGSFRSSQNNGKPYRFKF